MKFNALVVFVLLLWCAVVAVLVHRVHRLEKSARPCHCCPCKCSCNCGYGCDCHANAP